MDSLKNRGREVAEARGLERSEGERSEPERSGGPPARAVAAGAPPDGVLSTPDPEVPEKPVRRHFNASYKLQVLKELEKADQPGQIGAVLRREGLYSSHITAWQRQRDEGALKALASRKRGARPLPKNPLSHRVEELEQENAELRKRLKQAETIIDVQKKISNLLGTPLASVNGGASS
jgi:transposase